jgi:serine/threonine protein kinase
MNPEIETLFHELADLPPEEREARLRDRDPALRAEVEGLLQFDSENGDLLTGHVAAVAQQALDRPPAVRCGPYRLVSLLGRGGMGSVHLADRTDGEVEQRVAIKLLRFGGSEPAFRDRFLRERQILATLAHPGIARLLDAGHTPDGQPYLVMEFIDGQPIDAYAASLPVAGKLRLFLRVCDAVAYAHRNLIIHRDLKPSNILVDRAGEPKLLDFGIARILDTPLDQTVTQERLLTPDYASPEQIEGKPHSTASDVYSLGAVLYNLLTGRSPHTFGSDRADSIRAAICASDPPPPSRFNRDIGRDVDCIVRKALRKEPEERYVSVDAFADDIRAFLELRPVRARSGNAWYRTRKFLRRYWAPAAATGLIFASLSAGLYVANRQRTIAERRFEELRQLSAKIFDFDKAIRNLPGSMQARQQLVSASLDYLTRLGADAHGDLALAQEIADGYWRVARVQGVPTELNLGQMPQAETSLKTADGFLEAILASRPHDPAALFASGSVAHDRMILAQSQNRREDALALARKASARLDEWLRLASPDDAQRDAAVSAFTNIALAHNNLHLYEDAAGYARHAAEIAQSLPSPRARALSVLAMVLRNQGHLPEALDAIEQARKLAEDHKDSNETRRMMELYAILLRHGLILGEDDGVSLDRPAEAVEAFRKALDLTEEAARKNPGDYSSRSRLGTAARELANVVRHGDPGRALEIYDLGIRRIGEMPPNPVLRRETASLLASSSYALRALDRRGEARQRIDRALAILRETKDYPTARLKLDSELFLVLRAQAEDDAAARDPRRARAELEQLLALVAAAKPDPENDLRDADRLGGLYRRIAAVDRQTGDAAEADGMEARRLDLWRHWDSKLPHNAFIERRMAQP